MWRRSSTASSAEQWKSASRVKVRGSCRVAGPAAKASVGSGLGVSGEQDGLRLRTGMSGEQIEDGIDHGISGDYAQGNRK